MKFYLTFGSNSPTPNNFAVVDAPNYRKAREIVFERYDTQWAFLYREEEFQGQAERYGLTEIPLKELP